MKRLFAALVVAVLVAAAPGVAQDKKADDKKAEKADNPEFKNWAGFKAGSAVSFKMAEEAGGVAAESTFTVKLVEVKDDKLVIETAVSSKVNGMEFKPPAEKRDVPRHLDVVPKGLDPQVDKPPGTVEEGMKKVKVGGTEYECKWYKTKTKVKLPAGEEELEGEFWMSDVPGKLVKMVNKGKTLTASMELTDVTIKK